MTRGQRQAGFTLIELMVALVVSTVLVGLVLSIHMRMSLAYRSQQQVSELQQVLQAAQVTVQNDLRMAGHQMAQGFYSPGTPRVRQPAVQIINDNDAPDEIRIFYADSSSQARILPGPAPTPVNLNVDDASQFRAGDVVTIVAATQEPNTRGTVVNGKRVDGDGQVLADVITYDACVLEILSLTGNIVTFSEVAPWGMGGNLHCTSVAGNSMMYRLGRRAYRIDPTRKALSVLQMSPSGGIVANDWQDLGIGFVDMQVASRWADLSTDVVAQGVDTADADTDPLREWYSGNDQTTLSTPYTGVADPPTRVALLEVTMSFAVRTSREVEGVTSGSTPAFIDAARPSHGQVGDRPAIVLGTDPRPPELVGSHIYRYTTVRIDVRNLGVGL